MKLQNILEISNSIPSAKKQSHNQLQLNKITCDHFQNAWISNNESIK